MCVASTYCSRERKTWLELEAVLAARTINSQLEFIRDLNDSHDDLMGVAVFVEETEFNHGIIFTDMALDMDDLIVLQVPF